MLPAFTFASEYHGQILYNDLPVPGATITATQGDKQFTATADDQGAYAFTDLPGGTWKIPHRDAVLLAYRRSTHRRR